MEIPDRSVADRIAFARRKSTVCLCRCGHRAADLLPKPAEEGRDTAARLKSKHRRDDCKAQSFRADARNLTVGDWITQRTQRDVRVCERSLTFVRDDRMRAQRATGCNVTVARVRFRAALSVRPRSANAVASDGVGSSAD